jgi:pimeloyl-ACP methyl ester carboxylesterase
VDLAALVLLGGPGMPVDEILARKLALEGHGTPSGNLALVELAREIPGAGPQAQAELERAWSDHIAFLREEERAAALEFRTRLEPQIAPFFGFRMLRQTLSHDPRPDLGAVPCPVLAVVGAGDEPMLLGLPEGLRALAARADADVTLRVVPGVNHMLLEHADPDPRTWSQAAHDLAPEVARCVCAWLRERLAAAD